MAKKRINGHGHLLPNPDQIPSSLKEKKIFWIDDDRRFMRQGDWKRPVTDPSFFIKEKLEWMEAQSIDHEVILNLSQLYANGLNRNDCADVIRFQNDFNASVQVEYPSKITSGFVVQPAFLDMALNEIERCVNDLDLQLLCMPTHFQNQDGKWKSFASKENEPIFELANELKLAIEIHPYDAPKMIALEDQFWRFHLVWMCAQTADAYHMFSSLGWDRKFPDARVCFAHGNQYGQVNIGRRKQGFYGRPDLFEGAEAPEKGLGSPNVFYDTLVHDPYSLRLLKERQGAGQIVAGLDDPYPLGEMDMEWGSYPGKVIDEALEMSFITKEEKEAIWYDNVVNWIAGDQQEHYIRRINGL